jgi:peptide/nickel transport system permease protein
MADVVREYPLTVAPLPKRMLSGGYRFVRRNPPGAIAAVACVAIVLIAIFGRLVAPHPADMTGFPHLHAPTWSYPFGTDHLTRDLFSRILVGARNSVGIGFGSVLVGTLIGVTIGITSGYLGGAWGQLMSRLLDAALAFPALVFVIFFLWIFPPSFLTVSIAIGIVLAPGTARVVRGATLGISQQPFVEAAIVTGNSPLRIMTRHILPNVAAPIIVITTVQIGGAILIEAAISYLGLGISSAESPSWGRILQETRGVWQTAWWTSIVPGMAISVTVLSFNIAGDALRDILDPRMRN